MFDTMTMTKLVGGFCGALLVFMLGNWAAETLYHTSGGHGDDEHAAYVIDTGEDDAAGAEEEQGPTFQELFASASAADGERSWGKCRACHALDGTDGTGPHLDGVMGRQIAAVDGFNYSDALASLSDREWTPAEMDAWLENPKSYAPGNKMTFAGLRDMEERANLVAYLVDQSPGYTPPAAAEDASAMPAEEETTDTAAADTAAEETTEETAAAEDVTEETVAEETAAAEEAAAEETAAADAAADSPLQQALAQGDADAGEAAFRKCRACHKLDDGANGVGPHLYGVMGREIAGVDGFNYSDAMAGLDGTWTPEEMDAWLENPRGYAPGNKMSFAGVRDLQERADLITYLQTIGD
ncbi:c-type cytochrome [Rhodovulum sp. YNF3179]